MCLVKKVPFLVLCGALILLNQGMQCVFPDFPWQWKAKAEPRLWAYMQLLHAQTYGEGIVEFKHPVWNDATAQQALNQLDASLSILPRSEYPFFLVMDVWSGWGSISTQKKVVEWVVYHARQHVDQRWRWIVQAVWCARYQWKDMSLAVTYAGLLKNQPSVPAWAQSLGVWVLESQQDYEAAAVWTGALLQKGVIKDPSELAFLEKRLANLKKLKTK